MQGWARGVDTTRGSVARLYDYYLGGTHNFEVDREIAAQILTLQPLAPLIARANRAWLGRAVSYLAQQGIRQFLDIGSGIPTKGNVHEIAQAVAADSRVLYVDTDPVAVMHGHQILDGNDLADAVQGDLRDPGELLHRIDTDDALSSIIDLSMPTAIILASVVQFVQDDTAAAAAVRAVRERMAPGSYLAMSHPTPEVGGSAASAAEGAKEYRERTDSGFRLRQPDEILGYFDGFTLVPPGLVWVPEWRPDHTDTDLGPFVDHPSRSGIVAGVGYKDL
ncbi:SAM-dependent methyltransferase [Phytohabitans rumicis]|uniref:S-adenosyl methyltransferase n=1 Tax=Phytohabitans rumicis TaxID=1076125 RepID=A0A6V8LE86_9ACTN|nr:SAM-dependent methyltransferase [Phytohabitans rumicis]GFJ93278.1 hypothetical protein Prum_069200 [Phytohabitans rumicis]